MDKILAVLGDGIAIAALSIIASTSLSAWKAILPTARVPLQFRRDGGPGLRANRPVGLLFVPFIAIVLLFLPMLMRLPQTMHGQDAVILFIMRTLLAVAIALAYIVHMKQVMIVLAQEGQLRT